MLIIFIAVCVGIHDRDGRGFSCQSEMQYWIGLMNNARLVSTDRCPIRKLVGFYLRLDDTGCLERFYLHATESLRCSEHGINGAEIPNKSTLP